MRRATLSKHLYGLFIFICVMAGVLATPAPSPAAYSFLHAFNAETMYPDGLTASPSGSTFYGITGLSSGTGTLFKINADGTGFKILYNFANCGNADFVPGSALILSGSTLFGSSADNGAGGMIFKINTDGTGFKDLYDLPVESGTSFNGSLVLVGSKLYGGTSGSTAFGAVFRINTDGTGYEVLHNFDGADGGGCFSLLLSGSTLYGVSQPAGGNGVCAIFRINTDATGYVVLQSFEEDGNGNPVYPYALTLSGSTLYGATEAGGANDSGMIFKIKTDGTGFEDLYDADGGAYFYTSLALLGSTLYGGACNNIFRINTDGTGYEVMHNFSGGAKDGAYPDFLVKSGSKLYGLTSGGGSAGNGGYGYGTMFSLSFTAPLAPLGATAEAGNAQATVSFMPPNDGGNSITMYTVTSSGGQKASGTASPITVKGLTNGTAYTFTVTATNAIGAGPASNTTNTVWPGIVPGEPINVTAIPGNAEATVSFTAPAYKGSSSITGYTVTSNPKSGVDTGAGTTSTKHVVTGLKNWTSYTFTVTATNARGPGRPSSPSNAVIPGAPPATATLDSPTGKITTNKPTYTWNAVPYATWYFLWVYDSNGTAYEQMYTAAQANCPKGTGTCYVTPPWTLANGDYTWWVLTGDSFGSGPLSAPLDFEL
jgi:uncharacterized repeat protein (TIGR03803 family)